MQKEQADRIKANVDLRHRIWRDYQDYAVGTETNGYNFFGTEVELWDHEYEVRVNNERVETLKEINEIFATAKAIHADKQKQADEMLKELKTIDEIDYTFEDNLLIGAVNTEVITYASTYNDDWSDAIKSIEKHFMMDPRKYYKVLSGKSCYHIACFHRDSRFDLESRYRDAEERGNNGGARYIDGFDGSWADARNLMSHHKNIERFFGKRATELGYKHNPIEFGVEYTLDIGAKNGISHVQRVAALRMGIMIENPLTFVVNEMIEDGLYHITTSTGAEMLAIIVKNKASKDPASSNYDPRPFYIKTVYPVDKEAYFEEHGDIDELYQDDAYLSLEELAGMIER